MSNEPTQKTDFQRLCDYAGWMGSLTALVKGLIDPREGFAEIAVVVFIKDIEGSKCDVQTLINLKDELKQKYNL